VRTIAAEAAANYNNVAASIAKLVSFRYLRRDQHPYDRRRSVFRVIYIGELDRFAAIHSPGEETSPRGGSSTDERQHPKISPTAPVLSRADRESGSPTRLESDAISKRYFPKREEETKEGSQTPLRRSPVREMRGTEVAAVLASFERRLDANTIHPHEIQPITEWLKERCKETHLDDPIHKRARVLFEALSMSDEARRRA
jgi:hypothetical protein